MVPVVVSSSASVDVAVVDHDADVEHWRSRYAELAELSGSLAHEIKNPLSVIRLNVEDSPGTADASGALTLLESMESPSP